MATYQSLILQFITAFGWSILCVHILWIPIIIRKACFYSGIIQIYHLFALVLSQNDLETPIRLNSINICYYYYYYLLPNSQIWRLWNSSRVVYSVLLRLIFFNFSRFWGVLFFQDIQKSFSIAFLAMKGHLIDWEMKYRGLLIQLVFQMLAPITGIS